VSDDDSPDQKRSDRNLFLREMVAAAFGMAIFAYLIFGPGKLPELSKWNADTIALLANAATVAAAATIPAVILFGGTDLIAWIARVWARALREQRRRLLSERLSVRSSEEAFAHRSGSSRRRPGPSAGSNSGVGCLLPLVLFALVLWLAGWLIPRVIDGMDWNHADETATELPTYCSLETAGTVCTANVEARSPEDLGYIVCGRRGLGWAIYNANQSDRGYTFDPRHVPPGTPFTIQCP
jgi:Sec-independent protein translocase protein TatA